MPCCCFAVVLFLLIPAGLAGVGLVIYWLSNGEPVTKPNTRAEAMLQRIAKMANEMAKPDRPAGEWFSLFNDRDLEGWEVVGKGKWSVVDGILRADGSGTGWLASKRSFDELELELEYRLPQKGNSGVFLRARKDAPVDGRDFLEIQLQDDASYPDASADTLTGAVFKEAAPLATRRFMPPAHWAKLRVRATGQRIQVWVGEVPLLDHYTQRPEKSGLLGLQMFGTPVEFRNIRVSELLPPFQDP
jgi:hypothetical protein